MIEKRESSPTTLLSSTSDIEILNPMLPTDSTSLKDMKSLSSGVSANPLAQLAAACTSLCNDMKPKTTSPTYNRALGHQQFNYPTGQPVTSSIKTNPLLTPSSLISALPSAVATSLQGSQQATVDYSHLLTAQEILAKQASISLPCAQNVTSLDSTLALAASKAHSGNNLEYLTKLYLQASAAKKSTAADFSSSLDLLNSEKLLSQLSPSCANLQNGAAAATHFHNGLDYRLCPCVSCQTLRLGVLTAQQQLNVSSKSSVAATTSNNVTTTQQHFLLPHKNPLTGSLQYVPVCPDPSNCSLCLQLSQNNTSLSSLSAAAVAGQTIKSNCAALTTEQYLTALATHSAVNKSSTSPSPTIEKRQLNEFLAPLQINTSPSPAVEKPTDITCSWTENGLPCGQKFLSEDQLFEHIKKAHTSNSTNKQNSPPQLISFEEELQKLNANPLTSLSNLSKKVLPTSTASSARFHPYTRPSLSGNDSSHLNSSTNHITSNSSRPSALPLLSSSFVGSHNPLSTLSALTLPSTAGANLPFSISTSSANSQLLSNTQMSNLLFAAAAR